MEKLHKFCEFETKYKADASKLEQFNAVISSLPNKISFLYVVGPDYYYTKPSDGFARYRKAESENGRAELTFKEKMEGSNNNRIRKEVNWRVDSTPLDAIEAGLGMRGFDFDFKITKACWIYFFENVNVVFYTVFCDNKEDQSFIEIEVNEELAHTLTEEQAWEIIREYEKHLAPLNITHKNRLNKSLYEMYTNKKAENKDVQRQDNIITS